MPDQARRMGARLRWLPILVVIMLANAQCSGPLPPLPATPAGQVIDVAVLSPTTGELASRAQTMRNGIQLAFDQWNDRAGAGQPRLEWTPYHTNCTFASAEQAMRKALEDGAQFFIGPVCTEAAIAAAREAAAAQVLLIAPAAPNPLVTRDHSGETRPTVFGIAYTPDWQAYSVARFGLTELNLHRAAVLEPAGDRYGLSLSNMFKKHYQKMGGSVVFSDSVETASADLSQVFNASLKAGAELLYFPGSAPNANAIADQLHHWQRSGNPAELKLIGSDAWHSPALDLSTTEGSSFPVQYTSLNPEPEVQNWRATYKSTYAIEPDSLAALGFDAAHVLTQAIQHAHSLEPGAVATSLEILEFQGVTGAFQFDDHHNPRKTITFLQVRNQALVPYPNQ